MSELDIQSDVAALEGTAALAEELEELRGLKVGLDARRALVEDARRRLEENQGEIVGNLNHYVALRAGLRADLLELGRAGPPGLRRAARDLDDQRALLRRQDETL
eukprot:CAMPEP_0198579078 /NCGR_PEP_ID=MMETSP1462-20131121/121051_1 /TAXON_ID=1333877 /ORGANISM="Brandtodinium nutriculum, Strain RCC3387" /LENGTH=104 /DNA_ID=CAMNT_0044310393 /DNA_START=46 /DNA_END=356 /DNA_ORIENTATION=+